MRARVTARQGKKHALAPTRGYDPPGNSGKIPCDMRTGNA